MLVEHVKGDSLSSDDEDEENGDNEDHSGHESTHRTLK